MVGKCYHFPNDKVDNLLLASWECAILSVSLEGSDLKVLLSAYACEPNKGSEPGVGWNWTQALLRRGFALHVITRSNNRQSIEKESASQGSSVTFSYYDLPGWARAWKYWPGGIYLYYLLWQIGAYRLAKRLHRLQNFDLVHHVTFASYRQPSFMGGLGIPFIFGPVGGGETMPKSFHKGIPLSGRVAEMVRDFGSSLVAIDPLMRLTFSSARIIACTTSDTLARIPRRYHNKCIVQPTIGINESEIEPARRTSFPVSQFLYVGRLLYWKGLHLTLRALVEVRHSIPDVKLRIIGDGTDREWLKQVAHDANVDDAVEWIPAKPHHEIWQEYRMSLAFVFPSLHDSGGMVVLEALAAGLPVICLDLGGPAAIVTPNCGVIVQSRVGDEGAVIKQLAQAMIHLATDSGEKERLSEGALLRARDTTWDLAADRLYRALGT